KPRAREELDRELAFEQAGHLYARECAANTWYAIGALHLRRDRQADAIAAFTHAIERVPSHRLARVGLVAAGVRAESPGTGDARLGAGASVVDVAIGRAISLVLTGADAEAARLVAEALSVAQPGSAGW